MSTVTISKNEYESLLSQADAYKRLASNFASQIIEKPLPEVMKSFRSTGKYSDRFLLDLEDGLKDLRRSKIWKSE